MPLEKGDHTPTSGSHAGDHGPPRTHSASPLVLLRTVVVTEKLRTLRLVFQMLPPHPGNHVGLPSDKSIMGTQWPSENSLQGTIV